MKKPGAFKLERLFAAREHLARFQLSSSDCESMGLEELLDLADPETLGMWERLRLGYTESAGHPVLREEIAAQYPGLGPRNVIVVSPGEGILVAFLAMLEAGDHVIVTFPAYQSLLEIPRSLGCSVTPWPLERSADGWTLDPAFLESRLRRNTKLLVVNFPHNPTGFHPSREEFGRIVDIARRSGIYLFSDEMYRLLEPDESLRLEPAAALYGGAVSLAGLSKSYGLPGLRIGWLASGDPGLVDEFSKMRDYTTLCSSAPGEVLAVMALRGRERILARNARIVSGNLRLARDFFDRHRDRLSLSSPRAGPVALGTLHLPVGIDRFCSGLFETKGALLLPGSVFDLEGNCFRVGLGREGMADALRLLEEYIGETAAGTA